MTSGSVANGRGAARVQGDGGGVVVGEAGPRRAHQPVARLVAYRWGARGETARRDCPGWWPRWRLRVRELKHQIRQAMGMGCIGARAAARSSRRPITSSVTALSAGALLVAGGCTPSPQPTSTGTTSATVSTSPTTATTSSTSDPPTSSVPTTDRGIPPAARPNTIAGAEAFVRYYVDRVNFALRTSDPAVLDLVTGPSCPGCKAMRDLIAGNAAAGQHAAGDSWTAERVYTQTFDKENAGVVVTINQKRVDLVDDQGRPVDFIVAKRADSLITLKFSSVWRVERFQAM